MGRDGEYHRTIYPHVSSGYVGYPVSNATVVRTDNGSLSHADQQWLTTAVVLAQPLGDPWRTWIQALQWLESNGMTKSAERGFCQSGQAAFSISESQLLTARPEPRAKPGGEVWKRIVTFGLQISPSE